MPSGPVSASEPGSAQAGAARAGMTERTVHALRRQLAALPSIIWNNGALAMAVSAFVFSLSTLFVKVRVGTALLDHPEQAACTQHNAWQTRHVLTACAVCIIRTVSELYCCTCCRATNSCRQQACHHAWQTPCSHMQSHAVTCSPSHASHCMTSFLLAAWRQMPYSILRHVADPWPCANL